jgi:hypothetical protein
MKKLLIVALLPWLLGCNPKENKSVVVGIYSDNLQVFKIEPNFVMPFTPFNYDSLDLNDDNEYDIFFNKSFSPLSSSVIPATYLDTSDGLQIVLSEINNYPDSLNVGVLLNDELKWTQSSSNSLVLASHANRSISEPIGNFLNVHDKYIGFKLDQKYGWIKLDNAIEGDLVVKEVVISK